MFILKSRSPRRIDILKNLGLKFNVEPADIDETQNNGEKPLDYLNRIVEAKIEKKLIGSRKDLFLACDTIVVYNQEILHKPKDEREAFFILSKLNGKIHSVFSGCMLFQQNETDYFFEETKIQFQDWSERQIQSYIQNSKPFDKAGSYGIQDQGSPAIKWEGSYQNVMGFPIRSFYQRWQKWAFAWT